MHQGIALHAAGRGIERNQAVGIVASQRAQPHAECQRDQGGLFGLALVLANFAGGLEAQSFVQTPALGRGIQQYRAGRKRLEQALHHALADAPPLPAWCDDDQTQRGRGLAPSPAHGRTHDAALVPGYQALAQAEQQLPVHQAVRPMDLGRQGLGGHQIIGRHGVNRYAIVGGFQGLRQRGHDILQCVKAEPLWLYFPHNREAN
ncbi:hypothetical protein GALL_520310 [mine drainage metagenome]|uniref:Uncharacterized protein n=1 Tax=mine drainage metagenome TaxID=410659 RepID=A0A1J5PF03_9ZZZZ